MAIAFRIPWSKDIPPLKDVAHWAADNGFGAIDIGGPNPEAAEAVRGAGLEVGTFDLGGTGALLSPDADARRAGAADIAARAARAKDLGLTRAFGVFMPPDGGQRRADSFRYWSEGWPAASEALASAGIAFAMEGYPGGSPHYSALGVTPETVRVMLALDASAGAGALKLNFDPSHLVRVSVDPIRFLSEFGAHVVHAHGKDTAFDAARLYETGNLGASLPADMPGSAAKNQPGFGEGWWRYCIPGDGVTPWQSVAAILSENGYTGHVSVELEDFRYNGTWAGERLGLTRARQHLARFF
jgi:sugar phosphate isomerase/epimerase